jgi:hypothetical protein
VVTRRTRSVAEAVCPSLFGPADRLADRAPVVSALQKNFGHNASRKMAGWLPPFDPRDVLRARRTTTKKTVAAGKRVKQYRSAYRVNTHHRAESALAALRTNFYAAGYHVPDVALVGGPYHHALVCYRKVVLGLRKRSTKDNVLAFGDTENPHILLAELLACTTYHPEKSYTDKEAVELHEAVGECLARLTDHLDIPADEVVEATSMKQQVELLTDYLRWRLGVDEDEDYTTDSEGYKSPEDGDDEDDASA